jgi:hypothetical protein
MRGDLNAVKVKSQCHYLLPVVAVFDHLVLHVYKSPGFRPVCFAMRALGFS